MNIQELYNLKRISDEITDYKNQKISAEELENIINERCDLLKKEIFDQLKIAQYPKTFKEWMLSNFESNQLEDMIKYGVSGGFRGLTDTRDCIKLYEIYKNEIWDKLTEEALAFGSPSIMQFISDNFTDFIDTDENCKNYLVWYMAETIAREIVESEE